MRIAALDAAQLDRLEPLWAAMYAHHAAFVQPPGFAVRPLEASWATKRAALADLLAGGAGIVLAAEPADGDGTGAPLGFAALSVTTEAGSTMTGSPRPGELDALVVAAGARGAGVGRALVEAGRAWLAERGATAMVVQVRAANAEALGFYAALGAAPAFLTLAFPPPA